MTPQIQQWMQHVARSLITHPGNVLEIGAKNVNGSIRQFFADATSYTGTDMEAGVGVDVILHNTLLLVNFPNRQFDTVIACEVLEHDKLFLDTLSHMRNLLRLGGYLIITTPTFGFPVHRFPKDYWRFGEDAYVEIFFDGMEILDLRHLDSGTGKLNTLVGLARKRGNNG